MNIHLNALEGIVRGVAVCADIVGKTMGAKGRNVIIEEEFEPYSSITNDGATIIERMVFDDPLEKRGHAFVKEATTRSNRNSGDGSSTTTVLLNAILQEGIKSGESGIEIKKSLDELMPLIEQKIDEQKKGISASDIRAVALIAGEDPGLADKLQEIYKEIGKDGIISYEPSGTYDTSYRIVDGVRFDGTGFLSPYLVHDLEAEKDGRPQTKAIYENPTILVTKRRISSVNDVNPLLATLVGQNKKDLVIFTDDMDSTVASIMISTHRQKKFNICIIKAPVLWKNFVFEDFAKITGSTIIEDASGITLKDLPLDALGTCGKIIVDKDELTVIGTADITEHIKTLREEGTDDANRRLAWLQTKTAIVRLGAASESELSYKRLKMEDAVHSCRLALQDGVVAGGGVCLSQISRTISTDTLGGQILYDALKAPFNQIITNAGIGLNGFDGIVFTALNHGYDVKTGEVVNMFDAGIIDAAKVVKMAVKNAIGVASTILTSDTLLTLPPREKDDKKPFYL